MYVADEDLALAVLERELEFVVLDSPTSERSNELAVGMRAAKSAGAGAARLAALTGLSRQAVYDALKRKPTGPAREMRFLIAATILKNAQTPQSLASLLALPSSDVEPVITELIRTRVLKVAVANDDTQVLLPGDRALDALRDRLDDRRWVRLERFSIYLRLAEGETAKISAAATKILGDEHFAILQKGIASHVVTDELAFGVRADDRRQALETAYALWGQVRGAADLPPAAFPLADIIDPVRSAA